MPCLTFWNLKSLTLPVNIVQREPRDFVGAKPVGYQEKQDGVVTPSPYRSSIHYFQKPPDLIPGDGARHIGQTVHLRHFDRPAEILSRNSFTMTEPQKHPQSAAEISASAG